MSAQALFSAANFQEGSTPMNNEYEILEIGNAQDVIMGGKLELPPDHDGPGMMSADSDFEE
jgi:hypothetical protein